MPLQLSCAELLCHFPAGQEVQPIDPVVLYSPAPQDEHALTADAVEYFPATHSAQVFAPVLVPVFVIEPSWHKIQPVALLMSPV